jgi:FixJ family two-component response regulator
MEKRRILLIDDEDQFRSGAVIALKKLGYQVIDAENGFVGKNHIISSFENKKPFALIVLDIMMPKTSGTEILDFLTKYDEVPPVLVTTGFMDYDITKYSAKLENIDLLEKPFSSNKFSEKIKEMINADGGCICEQYQ